MTDEQYDLMMTKIDALISETRGLHREIATTRAHQQQLGTAHALLERRVEILEGQDPEPNGADHVG